MKFAYNLEINKNAKILYVYSKDEKKFLKRYGESQSSSNKFYTINWKKIKEDYDGVRFGSYFYKDDTSHISFHTYPLKDLGAESSVFFSPVVIHIEKIKNYNPIKIVKNMFSYKFVDSKDMVDALDVAYERLKIYYGD